MVIGRRLLGRRAELRVKLDTQVKLYALNLSDNLQVFSLRQLSLEQYP